MVVTEDEEVALQKREKKKNKRNKKIEEGFVAVKTTVCGETIALQGEDYGVGLGTSKKKGKKKDGDRKEMDCQNSESNLNDEDQTGLKSEKKKKKRLERREKRKGNIDEYCNKEKKESMKEKEVKKEKRSKNKKDMSSFTEDKEVVGDKETKRVEHGEREGIPDIKEKERRDKQKKKEKKEKKLMDKQVSENAQTAGLDHDEKESISDIKEWEESGKQKKKKKEKREKNIARNQELRKDKDHIDVGSEENIKYRHERKSRRENKENDNESGPGEIVMIGGGRMRLSDHKDIAYNDGLSGSVNKKRDRGDEVSDVENKKRNKKRKKANLTEDFEKKRVDMGEPNTENMGESTSDHSKNSKPKDSRKKVKFSDHVEEVFSSSIVGDFGKEKKDNLVRGKRFTRKEDDLVKDAVAKYIKDHNLGEKGTEMVLNCQKYRLKNCWKEIGAALPWRPVSAVYSRARILHDRDESRIWTEDELAFVIKYHEKHGPKWKAVAQILGKNPLHVKDAWRRHRLSQLKRGAWSQEEFQTLFDLVNTDLRMKIFEEKKSQHGMLRDDISWSVIGQKLGSRRDQCCCNKWYNSLRSPMVRAGEWDDTDDYRLLDELVMLDACCEEDVDWDNLLEHRSGYLSRKRWKQMTKSIGEHGIKSFAEQVEVLAKRYCPDLVEVRETIDSRTVVT